MNFRKKITIIHFLITLTVFGCGSYSFTGASIPEGTETFQVNFFENDASKKDVEFKEALFSWS